MQATLFTGSQLAEQGLNRAVEKANRDYDNWSDKAKEVAFKFIRINPKGFVFQIEDIRMWATELQLIEKPNNDRAWGCVAKAMITSKKVERLYSMPVSNPKAHAANAMAYKIIYN